MYELYEYAAKLHRVVDGDTVVFLVDLGFHVWVKETCRLAGIDAPEMRGAERSKGIAAKEHLELLLEDYAPVKVYTQKDRTGKYGRYLVTIESLTGVNINTRMVSDGHAVVRYA